MRFLEKYLFLLLSIIVASGCETSYTYRVSTPEGFAAYTREKKYYKAISADGVRIRVYTVLNDPPGDRKMWQGAIAHYLKGIGYHLKDQKEVRASDGLKGDYTEYLYRYNARNYIYSLTLFISGDTIYVLEAGGIEKEYRERKSDLEKMIAGFSTK